MTKSNENLHQTDFEAADPIFAEQTSIGINASDTLIEGAHKILRFYYSMMLSHEAGTHLGDDPEELHDMRVCTRRLRAVFDIFETGFSKKTLRKHRKGLRAAGRALGLVRDWDVFLLKSQQDIASLQEIDQKSLQPIVNKWQNQRQQARIKMVKFLDSSKFQSFKTSFLSFACDLTAGAKKPVHTYFEGQLLPEAIYLRDLVPGMLYARLAKIRAYESVLPGCIADLTQTQMAHLHALRIEVKKMHYSLDFFKEILEAEGKVLLKAVKKLQDLLGELHDADVACICLEEITPFPALQIYIKLKKQQRQDLLKAFPDAWQDFNSPENRSLLAYALIGL